MAVVITIKDINGNVHTLTPEGDVEKSIVDMAEEQGIELPYSCRSGACFSCCAGVNKGMEYLDKEKTGEALIDVEPGEVLTCICGIKSSVFEKWDEVEIEMEMFN